MKLVSLWEPWATLMALGHKRIETRSWRTSYRGWLAIHASKGGLTKAQLRDCLAEPVFAEALDGAVLSPGCIVAVTFLEDCCPMEDTGCLLGVFKEYPELDTPKERAFGDFSPGRWAWVTRDLRPVPEPIPYKAAQGLCDLREDVRDELRHQFKEMRSRSGRPTQPPAAPAGVRDDHHPRRAMPLGERACVRR